MFFEESVIPDNFCKRMYNKTGNVSLATENASIVIKVILEAMADYAGKIKSKESPSAVVINDLKNNLLLGYVVRYHEGEEDMPGNWSIECALEEEDIKDCIKYPINESKVNSFFDQRAKAANPQPFMWNKPTHPYLGAESFASVLLEWLDDNATPDKEVELVLDGYFKAAVVVEDGKKYKSVDLDGAIKRLIKGDALLETK